MQCSVSALDCFDFNLSADRDSTPKTRISKRQNMRIKQMKMIENAEVHCKKKYARKHDDDSSGGDDGGGGGGRC